MGMFDYVDYEMYCPMCGVRVSDFQSKSAGCTLAQLSPAALAAEADPGIEYGVEFYSDCESCGTWITVKYRRGDTMTTRDELMCPDCEDLPLIVGEAESDDEPTVGYCPDCGHSEQVAPPDSGVVL